MSIRNNTRSRVLRLGVALVVSLAATLAQAAIVVNGGFEVGGGTLTGWTLHTNPGGGTSIGINTDAGPFFDNGVTPDPTHVAYLQKFGGSIEPAISQVIAVNMGDIYSLSLSYNARAANDLVPPTVLRLSIDGGTTTLLSDEFQRVQAAPNHTVPFHSTNVTFTATGTSINLWIENASEDGIDRTLLVDAIVLELVPEPSTVLLLGFGGLLLWRRRE